MFTTLFVASSLILKTLVNVLIIIGIIFAIKWVITNLKK